MTKLTSVNSILGIVGTYLISTASTSSMLVGFIVYLISDIIWIYYWYKTRDWMVIVQYIVFTVLAINGIYNTI